MLREWKKFLEIACQGHISQHKLYKNGFYAYFMDTICGEDGDYTLADVMDDFIFLLVKRDAKLNEFDQIFDYMLGAEALNGALDINVYNPIKRLQSNNNFFGFASVNEACIQQ